jgi:type II secretory pathway component PulC
MRPLVLRLPALIAPLVSLSLLACGAAPPPVPAAVAPAGVKAAAPPEPVAPAAPLPEHALPRSAVHDVVSQGLGAFLQRIELDDQPVRVGGKFRGFRVAQLRGGQFWSGVDLRPGDVIAGVNGFPIERPEQAQMAFESLEVASELRVAYERDGQPRELTYAIVDDR